MSDTERGRVRQVFRDEQVPDLYYRCDAPDGLRRGRPGPLGAETTNGDGFGVGWCNGASVPRGVFRSIEPACNDANLRELAGHVSSPLFFAHIGAAIGSAVQQTNCHPFRPGRWLWIRNGSIDGFAAIKRDLVLAAGESLLPDQGAGR